MPGWFVVGCVIIMTRSLVTLQWPSAQENDIEMTLAEKLSPDFFTCSVEWKERGKGKESQGETEREICKLEGNMR